MQQEKIRVFHKYFGKGYIVEVKNLVEKMGRMIYVQFSEDKIWVDEKNIEYVQN